MTPLQDHLISALRVFASAFFVTLATSISATGSITWSGSFWTPLAIAGISAGLKAAINAYLNTTTVNTVQQ